MPKTRSIPINPDFISNQKMPSYIVVSSDNHWYILEEQAKDLHDNTNTFKIYYILIPPIFNISAIHCASGVFKSEPLLPISETNIRR